MAKIYVALIIKKQKIFSDVPESKKEQVRQMLIDLNLEELTQ